MSKLRDYALNLGLAKKKDLDGMARCLGKAIDLCLLEDRILMPEKVSSTIIAMSFDGYIPESMMGNPSVMIARIHKVKSRPQFKFKKMKLSDAVSLALDNLEITVKYTLDGKYIQNQGRRYVYYTDEEMLKASLKSRLSPDTNNSSHYILEVF